MVEHTQDIGGRIVVRLKISDGVVSDVLICSTRPMHAADIFIGYGADKVAELIGSVYSLCGKAQSIAALAALENAMDISVSPAQTAARDALRLAEMLGQAMMRTCLGWPRLLGLELHPQMVRQFLQAEGLLERHLMGGQGWKTPGGVALNPDRQAASAVVQDLQGNIAEILAPNGLAEVLQAALKARNLQGFGALASGMQPEGGALSRNCSAPDVCEKVERYGAGLSARLAAGFVDLQALGDELAKVVQAVAIDAPIDVNGRNGEGEATVETVRGPLHHRVQLKDGIVKSMQINAPTEVNFRPDGPIAQGLRGVDATDDAALEQAAELHVLAIDPCVETQIELHHA